MVTSCQQRIKVQSCLWDRNSAQGGWGGCIFKENFEALNSIKCSIYSLGAAWNTAGKFRAAHLCHSGDKGDLQDICLCFTIAPHRSRCSHINTGTLCWWCQQGQGWLHAEAFWKCSSWSYLPSLQIGAGGGWCHAAFLPQQPAIPSPWNVTTCHSLPVNPAVWALSTL